jgi:hypothetical protein
MTKAPIAADIHQALDVHRGFTTKITLNGEQRDLVADLFKIAISQIFDFLGIRNIASLANLASSRATNAKNRSQTDFGVLLGWNIYTCYTSHVRPLNLLKSALTLFVTRICADDAYDAFTADDLAVAANFLDRC